VSTISTYPALEKFYEYAQKRIAEGASIPDVIDEGLSRFCGDGKFVRQFVVDAMKYVSLEAATSRKPVIITEGEPAHAAKSAASVAQQATERGTKGYGPRHMHPRTRKEFLKSLDDPRSPVARFFEKHPDTRVAVKILTLTREDLLKAAIVRDEESAQARRRALLCREVASALAPGQRAQEVFTERDLAQLEKAILEREQPTPIKSSVA
jgi:hypothetical protein